MEAKVVGLPLFPRDGVLEHPQQAPDVSIVPIKLLEFDFDGDFSLKFGRDLEPHSIEFYLGR